MHLSLWFRHAQYTLVPFIYKHFAIKIQISSFIVMNKEAHLKHFFYKDINVRFLFALLKPQFIIFFRLLQATLSFFFL